MKRFLIKYKRFYFDDMWCFMIVDAETPQDANSYFFGHHSGVIFETKQLRS